MQAMRKAMALTAHIKFSDIFESETHLEADDIGGGAEGCWDLCATKCGLSFDVKNGGQVHISGDAVLL